MLYTYSSNRPHFNPEVDCTAAENRLLPKCISIHVLFTAKIEFTLVIRLKYVTKERKGINYLHI